MKIYSFIIFIVLSGKITSIYCVRNPDHHLDGQSFASLNSEGEGSTGEETVDSGTDEGTQQPLGGSGSPPKTEVTAPDPAKPEQGKKTEETESDLDSKTKGTELNETTSSQPSDRTETSEQRVGTEGQLPGVSPGTNAEPASEGTDHNTALIGSSVRETQNGDTTLSTNTLRTQEPEGGPGPSGSLPEGGNVTRGDPNLSSPGGKPPTPDVRQKGSSRVGPDPSSLPSKSSEPDIHPLSGTAVSTSQTVNRPVQPTQAPQNLSGNTVNGTTVEVPINPLSNERTNGTAGQNPSPSALDNLPTLDQDTTETQDQNTPVDKESKVKNVLLGSLRQFQRNMETLNTTELALPPEDYFQTHPKSFCKAFKINNPVVCTLSNDKSQLVDLVNAHYVENVCATENSLTQLYNKDGNFSYKLLEKYSEQFKKKAPSKNIQDVYDKSVPVVNKLTELMKNAELSLVSDKVKSLLEKRNLLLAAALCGVASEEQSIMSSTEYNGGRVVLTVNEESLIEEATTVFMKAYQPMVELLKEFNMLLPKLLDLFEEAFENKINLLTSMANVVNPRTQSSASGSRTGAPPNPQRAGPLPTGQTTSPTGDLASGGVSTPSRETAKGQGQPDVRTHATVIVKATDAGRNARELHAKGPIEQLPVPPESDANNFKLVRDPSELDSATVGTSRGVEVSSPVRSSGSHTPSGSAGTGVVQPGPSPPSPEQKVQETEQHSKSTLQISSNQETSALETGKSQNKLGSALLQFFGNDDREVAAVHGHPSLIQRFKSLLQLKTKGDTNENTTPEGQHPSQSTDVRNQVTNPGTTPDTYSLGASQTTGRQGTNPVGTHTIMVTGGTPTDRVDVQRLNTLEVFDRTTPGGVNNSDHSTQRNATSGLTTGTAPGQLPKPGADDSGSGLMTKLRSVLNFMLPGTHGGATTPGQSNQEPLNAKQRNHQKEQELLKEALKHFAFLDFFKTSQGKLLAELDEQKVKALVRANLLSLNNFDPMYNLIVGPQRAMHSLYRFVERLLLSPDADERITNLSDSKILEQIKSMVEPLEDLYEQIKGNNPDLRLRTPNLHGQEGGQPLTDHRETTHRHHNLAGDFVLVSNASGVKLSEDLLGKPKGSTNVLVINKGTFSSTTLVLISSVLLILKFL